MGPVSICSYSVISAHTAHSAVELQDEQRYLKYAFRARNADNATRDEIAKERGVRWSTLNELAGWWPASNSPPDFMHAAYLGESRITSVAVTPS